MTTRQRFDHIMRNTTDAQLLELWRNDEFMQELPIMMDGFMMDEMERRGITWYSPDHDEYVYKLGEVFYILDSHEPARYNNLPALTA